MGFGNGLDTFDREMAHRMHHLPGKIKVKSMYSADASQTFLILTGVHFNRLGDPICPIT